MDISINISSIIEQAANAGGFIFTEEFSPMEMTTKPDESICISAINSHSFSPKIRSCSGEVFGVEVEYQLKIRLYGERKNYGDYTQFGKKVTQFINYLGLSSDLIITRLNRDEVKRNALLSRLETQISLQLKCCYLSSEVENGGGA